jgi:hypothetical protein
MPIFIMALLALAMFLVMGLMLFYATYKEHREPDQPAPKPSSR